MSRIISSSGFALTFAAMAAFSALPAFASSAGQGEANSPHVMLVHGGGGGGGGGHGGGGGGHGGGGFSGGGGSAHGFSGGNAHAFSANGGLSAGSFNGNSRSFADGGRSSFSRGGVGADGYGRGGWNNGNWAWGGRGGYYGGWGGGGWGGWGFGYPLAGWLGGYGWYPGYYYGDDNGPYDYNVGYGSADTAQVPQSYAAVQPQQANQSAEDGQGSEFLDQAIQSFQSGDYRNAMRLAEHAIVDSPRNPEAHEVVVLAALANKDYRTAATEAHAVIALGGVPSWNQVYAIYQNVDAYTSQLRALEDYVKEHPKSAEGQFLLGFQYTTTGYSSEAHDHLVKAGELTPKDKIVQEMIKGIGGESPATANRQDAPAAK